MNIWLANGAYIATIVLAFFALIAAIFGILNLFVLKKKYRYDILVSLTDQVNSKEERQNRAIIHSFWKNNNLENESSEVGNKIFDLFKSIWKAQAAGTKTNKKDVEIKDAIEATVACLDKIGYFLMERDKAIQEETPIQIWSIAEDMWKKLRTFVEKRHEQKKEVWATYFEKLGHEAKNRMAKWRLENPHEPTTKIE